MVDQRNRLDEIEERLARLEAALFAPKTQPPMPRIPLGAVAPSTCQPCGLNLSGAALGYVCPHLNCPTFARWVPGGLDGLGGRTTG